MPRRLWPFKKTSPMIDLDDQGDWERDVFHGAGRSAPRSWPPMGNRDFGWQRAAGKTLASGKKSRFPSRWVWQMTGAALLFLTVYGLFQLKTPWALTFQEEFRRVTNQELDYEPARQAMVRLGLWTDATMAVPVIAMGQSGPVSGRVGLKVETPVEGVVLEPFGWAQKGSRQEFQPGIKISAPAGSPVVTPVGGEVEMVQHDRELGQLVTLRWEDGRICLFGHLDPVLVKKGQTLAAGETVGRIGTPDGAGGGMLYWELRQGTRMLDPLKWQGKAGVSDEGGANSRNTPSRQ